MDFFTGIACAVLAVGFLVAWAHNVHRHTYEKTDKVLTVVCLVAATVAAVLVLSFAPMLEVLAVAAGTLLVAVMVSRVKARLFVDEERPT